MEREQIAKFITEQRNNNIPDDQIYSFLKNKGVIKPTQPELVEKATQDFTPEKTEQIFSKDSEVVGGLAGRVLGGVEKTVKPLGEALGRSLTDKKNLKVIGQAQDNALQIQADLVERIKAKKASGKDFSLEQDLLASVSANIQGLAANTESLITGDITSRDVAGSAIKTAGIIAGSGTIPGLQQATGATTFIKGLQQGAKAGALTGGILGATTGLGEGIQDEEKNALQVAGQSVTQGAIGALSGAVVGGLIGGVSGQLRGKKLQKALSGEVLKKQGLSASDVKKYDSTLDITQPRLTRGVVGDATRQGRLVEVGTGPFKKTTVAPSRFDMQVAKAADEFIEPNQSIARNVANLRGEVGRLDDEIVVALRESGESADLDILSSNISKAKNNSRLMFRTDPQLEKAYDGVVDEMLAQFDNVEGDDLEALFQARKNFDRAVDAAGINIGDDPANHVMKNAVRDIRRAVNDTIEDQISNPTFRNNLTKEFHLLTAVDNIADKSSAKINSSVENEIGKSAAKILMDKLKRNPLASAGIGAIGATGAARFLVD